MNSPNHKSSLKKTKLTVKKEEENFTIKHLW